MKTEKVFHLLYHHSDPRVQVVTVTFQNLSAGLDFLQPHNLYHSLKLQHLTQI